MSIELRPGVVNELKSSGAVQHALTLRVTDLQEANGKLKCNFSDSKENIPGVMTSQVRRHLVRNSPRDHPSCNILPDRAILSSLSL